MSTDKTAAPVGSEAHTDLLVILTHELGTVLEMNWGEGEMKELWPEALEALVRAKDTLQAAGVPLPSPAQNILDRTRDADPS